MTLEHSPVGASGAAQRIQCPGSVTLQRQFPETERSAAALDGDAAHWALARMWQGQLPEVNDRAPNGVFLTDEMIEAVDLCYDKTYALLKQWGKTPADLVVESTLPGRRIHERAFGTPDARLWVSRKHLFVLDFKFGHRYVDAVGNHQLIDYVAYCLDEPSPPVDDRQVYVTAVICQPRAYHRDGPYRVWEFVASDIRAHINISSNAAHEALGDKPRTRVGPACRDCRARHACETFTRAAQADLHEIGGLQTLQMTPAALGLQLRRVREAQERLQAYATGLEEQAFALERSGTAIPGWRTERSVGRERWTADIDQIRAIGEMLSLKLVKEQPITPAQARKAGVPDETVRALAERPASGVALVPDDGSVAKRVFG